MNYVPNTTQEQKDMLAALGMQDFMDLYQSVPDEVLLKQPLGLSEGLPEIELIDKMTALANKNKVYTSIFRGAGAYKHHIPAVVDTLSARGEFVTAYTPYQAELSQGILQGIFEYQTMICEITGMDASNASVYDGATAAGEAALMVKDRKRHKVLVSQTANAQVVETMKTYAIPAGIEIVAVPEKDGLTDVDALKNLLDEQTAGVYVQQPNYYGLLEDMQTISVATREVGAKLIAGVAPISLGLINSPAEYDADIVVGDGQALGIPLSFGGPGFGFMATTKANMRKLPGRIVGQTTDKDGKRAFVLTLQAREQHIRREKASSNICSNQAWCALRGAMYMSIIGKEGFKEVAAHCYANAHYLADCLAAIGFTRVHAGEFYHEFATTCPVDYKTLETALQEKGILAGLPLEDGSLLWCATELNSKEKIDALIAAMKEVR